MDASPVLLVIACAFVGALFGYNIGWLRGYDKRTKDVEHYRKLWHDEMDHNERIFEELAERTARDDDDDSVELTAT